MYHIHIAIFLIVNSSECIASQCIVGRSISFKIKMNCENNFQKRTTIITNSPMRRVWVEKVEEATHTLFCRKYHPPTPSELRGYETFLHVAHIRYLVVQIDHDIDHDRDLDHIDPNLRL